MVSFLTVFIDPVVVVVTTRGIDLWIKELARVRPRVYLPGVPFLVPCVLSLCLVLFCFSAI